MTTFLKKITSIFIYLGLFTLPLILLMHNFFTKKNLKNFILLFFIILGIFYPMFIEKMPYLLNTVHKQGIGTPTIEGDYIDSFFGIPIDYFWLFISVSSNLMGVIIFFKIIRQKIHKKFFTFLILV